jgi:hypothetical protein
MSSYIESGRMYISRDVIFMEIAFLLLLSYQSPSLLQLSRILFFLLFFFQLLSLLGLHLLWQHLLPHHLPVHLLLLQNKVCLVPPLALMSLLLGIIPCVQEPWITLSSRESLQMEPSGILSLGYYWQNLHLQLWSRPASPMPSLFLNGGMLCKKNLMHCFKTRLGCLFHYRLRTTQSLRLQGLWTKT